MNELLLIGLQNAAIASVLALLVWVITRFWKSAPVVHVLWLLVLIKLLTPPLVPVDLATWAPWRINLQTGEPVQPMPEIIAPSEVPDTPMVKSPMAHTPLPAVIAVDDDQYAHEVRVQEAVVHAYLREVWDWCSTVLFFTWLAGTCCFGIIAGVRIARFRQLVNGMLPASTCWQELTRELAARLTLRRVPQVLMSERVHAPLLWCCGRQRAIVLPLHLVSQLEAEQMELVLAHELTHLRRRDHWVRLIELLSSVIYWWNPVVWWARRSLHQAEEQCCDAWVNWLFPDRAKGYAEVLLYAAESKAPARAVHPLLASPFFRSSASSLKTRIQMILRGGIRRTLSHPVRALLIVLALVVLPLSARWTLAGGDEAPISKPTAATESKPPTDEATPCKMVGTVTVKGTGAPVANATVNVLVEGLPSQQRVRRGQTDANGRYEIAVPLGHARAFGVTLPAGYWVHFGDTVEAFAVSPAHPEFTKHFSVRREPVWKVRLKLPDERKEQLKVSVSGHQQIKNDVVSVGCQMDQNETGLMTVPGDAGTFNLSIWSEDFSLERTGDMTLQFDKGFQPGAVAASKQLEPLSYELTDDQGRKATLKGLEVSVAERQAVLAIPTRARESQSRGRLTGIIADQDGKPLEGAKVGLAFHDTTGSGAMDDWDTRTDAQGRFNMERIPRFMGVGVNNQLSVIVNCDGWGGIDTPPFDAKYDANGTIDVGEIRLKPGRELKLRIVDHEGNPAAGASVEPSDGYAARAQATRTDSEGRCVIKNLAIRRGVLSLAVYYGSSAAHPTVVSSNKEITVRLQRPMFAKPEPAVTPPVKAAPIKGLAVGETVPEWSVAEWSDGKTRKLADYRGKIVVLDFWGIWCGPCLQTIPVLRELEERYAKQGVVFLSIHTPGTSMDQIQELQAQHKWKAVTVIDRGIGEASEKERQIIQELEKPSSFDFTDETLEGAFEMIQKRHGFEIVIDKAKLKEKRIATGAFDVGIKVTDITLKNVLKLLLEPKKLTYVIENDALKITIPSEPAGDQQLTLSGRTAKSYGVRSYPTILVIDKQGKIAFTSNVDQDDGPEFMKKIEAIHKELGIPFPPDKDANDDEAVIIDRLNKVQLHIFGKAIEDVLKN